MSTMYMHIFYSNYFKPFNISFILLYLVLKKIVVPPMTFIPGSATDFPHIDFESGDDGWQIG